MLLNKKGVRLFAMACAANRSHKFSRVGAEFYDRVEFIVRATIRKEVDRLPSKGRTIL